MITRRRFGSLQRRDGCPEGQGAGRREAPEGRRARGAPAPPLPPYWAPAATPHTLPAVSLRPQEAWWAAEKAEAERLKCGAERLAPSPAPTSATTRARPKRPPCLLAGGSSARRQLSGPQRRTRGRSGPSRASGRPAEAFSGRCGRPANLIDSPGDSAARGTRIPRRRPTRVRGIAPVSPAGRPRAGGARRGAFVLCLPDKDRPAGEGGGEGRRRLLRPRRDARPGCSRGGAGAVFAVRGAGRSGGCGGLRRLGGASGARERRGAGKQRGGREVGAVGRGARAGARRLRVAHSRDSCCCSSSIATSSGGDTASNPHLARAGRWRPRGGRRRRRGGCWRGRTTSGRRRGCAASQFLLQRYIVQRQRRLWQQRRRAPASTAILTRRNGAARRVEAEASLRSRSQQPQEFLNKYADHIRHYYN